MKGKDYKIIRTSVHPSVGEVRLYDETIQHIKDQHPEVPIELPSISTAVENTIVNPTHIEKSYANSYVFVDSSSTNASGDPLRVPIKGVTGNSARVKTAYFATTETDDNIIWRRENDV